MHTSCFEERLPAFSPAPECEVVFCSGGSTASHQLHNLVAEHKLATPGEAEVNLADQVCGLREFVGTDVLGSRVKAGEGTSIVATISAKTC
jgi:hypothetical protein